jgi:HK97 family phage major capsid protein
MGHLKDLRDKQAAGTLTDAEAKELKELEQDFKDMGDDAEEKAAVEELSDKLAGSFLDKIAPITQLAERLNQENSQEKKAENTSTKMIHDPRLGEVSVQSLEDQKVELTDRKAAGKKHTTVSMKTIHFIQAMATNNREKLQTLVEGTAARGGYLVPEDFVNIVVEDRRDMTVMRQLATVLPVSTDTIHIPNLASRPKAFWRSEAAVKATTTVDFGETVLTPYSLAAIVGLSNELVADAQLGGPIISLVANYMARALAEEEDKKFWEGNGSGVPTGIDNYSFNGVTAPAGASDSVKADSIIRATYVLPQSYRNNAVWVANKNTWAKVATLKDGQNNYLLSDLGNGANPALRGRPYYEQNDIPDGRMFLGDFSFYYIADRQGITVDTSTEATVASQSAFERNLTFVRVEERVDGELTITQPIVEVNGIGGF